MINEIAKRHNGGGHPPASGANSTLLRKTTNLQRATRSSSARTKAENRFSAFFYLGHGYSFVVAILSSFLPWASLNAGNFGSYSWNGLRGDGWFVIIFAVVVIVLSCLNDVNFTTKKKVCIGVIVAGALLNYRNIDRVFGVNKYAVDFNGMVAFQWLWFDPCFNRINRYC